VTVSQILLRERDSRASLIVPSGPRPVRRAWPVVRVYTTIDRTARRAGRIKNHP
jgi:hypothetical protein